MAKGTTPERFWKRVDMSAGPDACWPYQGTTYQGYGRIRVGDRQISAHRYAYELLVGSVDEGETLDHRCHTDDPLCCGGYGCLHRACCNPAHLERVTVAINTLRGLGPPAVNARKTHCIHGHEFTPENTAIKHSGGTVHRACRECRNARDRAAYKRDPQAAIARRAAFKRARRARRREP